MKLRIAAALIALPLLAGCGDGPATESADPSSSSQPNQVDQPAATMAAAPAVPEFTEPPVAQMVLDLTKQTLTVPNTAYGSLSIPVLAPGGINTGTRPAEDALDGDYSHCGDQVAGSAWEPDFAGRGGYDDVHLVQFITFDPGCWAIPIISGHTVVVPQQVSIEAGPTVAIKELLPSSMAFVVEGISPMPEASLISLGLAALGKIKVNWPANTETAARVS
jgi:hypothetical protein